MEDFEGWDHSVAGYATDYLVFAVCLFCLLPCWYWEGRFREVEMRAESESEYLDDHGIQSLMDECEALLAWEQPRDPLGWLQEHLRRRRAREKERKNLKQRVRANLSRPDWMDTSSIASIRRGGAALRRCFGSKRRRTVHAQFLLFALAEGICSLLAGLARHRLDAYAEAGQVMGRQWGSDNSDWLYLWLPAVFVAPLATTSAAAIAMTFMLHEDWSVHLLHVIGLMAGLSEVVVLALARLKITGKIGQYFAVVVLGCVALAHAVRIAHQRNGLRGGNGALFVGILFLLGGSLEFPARSPSACRAECQAECSRPDGVSNNAVFHLLIASAVIALFVAVQQRIGTDWVDMFCCNRRRPEEAVEPADLTPVQPFGTEATHKCAWPAK
mmetsp:Transcript_23786/g.68658  ORF Transcript_23786/g.68658 Transcript_23786/m.68658 type:complete len:385 (-) Transcript_23786:106-1260(-)